MRTFRAHVSLRLAIALFLTLSIGLGVVLNRNTKYHEETFLHWPTLDTYTERRTYFFEREVSYSLKDQTGRAVSNIDPNDLFRSFGTGLPYG